jgi:hypothetical protein
VARRRQGVAGDFERATGKVPGKEERAGAHRNGRSTMRRRKRHRAVVSNSGGVAPVVVDVRGGVLQHRCGRGKRDLAPIRGMTKLEGRSPERGNGGDARTEFSAEEGLQQRKAGEADAGSVGKRVRRSGVDR